MTMDMKISRRELCRFLEGEVTRKRSEEIEAHLADCRDCRRSYQKLRDLVGLVGEPDERLAGMDLVEDLQLAIRREPAAPKRRAWLRPLVAAVVTGLVLAAAIIVWQTTREDAGQFRTKGSAPSTVQAGRWAGVHVLQLPEGGKARPVGKKLTRQDPLLFGYTNLGGRPYSYLMIFAVDHAGRVYWFYPAYLERGTDPYSIEIRQGESEVELPEAVSHAFPAGPLAVYGLFTHRPLQVKWVEEEIKQLVQAGTWNARRPNELKLESAAQHILTVEVEP